MSLINGNSKNQMANINIKKIEDKKKPLTQRAYFLNKYYFDLNYPNIFQKKKGKKRLTSKYNTLKNSRKFLY